MTAAQISCPKMLAAKRILRHLRRMSPLNSSALRHCVFQNRRHFLSRLTWGTMLFAVPGAFAEQLIRTPAQTEGPFYPDHLPLDTDNDLLIVNDSLTSAVGEVTWLSGRILDARGEPMRNALVEIWQCDAHGVYVHSGSNGGAKRDSHFQ